MRFINVLNSILSQLVGFEMVGKYKNKTADIL